MLPLIPLLATGAAGALPFFLNNPADKAKERYGKIADLFNITPELQTKYRDLMNNPSEFYNQLASGYKESPGLQTKLKFGQAAAEHAANAAGMGGSPEASFNAARKANELYGTDFEDYLKHVLGLSEMGLKGLGTLQEQGASGQAQMGGLDFLGQKEDNSKIMGLINALASALGGKVGS